MRRTASRRPLRIGVIGAGNIATLAHIPGLLRTRDADVVAICDPDVPRAAAAQERFRIEHSFDSYERMLETVPLDAVTVATPPVTHVEAVLQALDRGLPVLCEKPLATSVADAERMVERADRAGLILAMNFHFRVLTDSLALKSAVDAGRLGALQYVNIRYLRNDFMPPPGSWARRRDISGGGSLMDMGSHLVDLALWLTAASRATSVDAHMHRSAPARNVQAHRQAAPVEDFASLHMRLDTGAVATVESSWGFFGPDERRIQVIGDRGGAEVTTHRDGRSGGLVFYTPAPDGGVIRTAAGPRRPRTPGSVSYAVATGARSPRRPRSTGTRSRRGRLWHLTMASFIAALRGEGEPVATGRDGLAVQRVLEAAYRSSQEARPVL